MTTTATGYIGWHRPAGSRKWVKLSVAPTWAECWQRLLQTERVTGGESVVLENHRNPNQERSRPR